MAEQFFDDQISEFEESRRSSQKSTRTAMSRDHIPGTRDVQSAEGMKKVSIVGLEGDGHYATRKSTGLDVGREQSRTHSPRSRGRSFK